MATGFGQRWPLQQQPAAPAGSTPCQQGAQRVGRRPVWPGEGWQHGSGRPRGQVKPPLRAATPTPRHPRDHRPWLRWLLLPAGSQGLLLPGLGDRQPVSTLAQVCDCVPLPGTTSTSSTAAAA